MYNKIINYLFRFFTDKYYELALRAGKKKCRKLLEVCCQPADPVVAVPTTSAPLHVKCGQRNPNGAGIKLSRTTDIAEYGEFPWMVAVLKTNYDYTNTNDVNDYAICGGSLINENVVLTAAHCIITRNYTWVLLFNNIL